MGGDAELSQASPDDLAKALSITDIAPELQSAVIARDAARLGMMLAPAPECMLLAPPGPPGPPGPSPMRPGVPPPPPEDAEEDEQTRDFSRQQIVAEDPEHRSGSKRA